ncbi:MAG TPA: TlpA disulfide reductase family protein [Bacteroidia bacterium]
MMSKFKLLLTLVCVFKLSTALPAKNTLVKGHLIGNSKYEYIVVYSFNGVLTIQASCQIVGDSFEISLPGNIPVGVYRFKYGHVSQDDYVDVLIDHQDDLIRFDLDVSANKKKPIFYSSKSNQSIQDWKREQDSLLNKIQVVSDFISKYNSKNESIYKVALKTYYNQTKAIEQHRLSFIKAHHDQLEGKIAALKKVYFPQPDQEVRLQLYYAQLNFWNGIEIKDTSLIHSPYYTQIILEYLKYYMDPSLGLEESELTTALKKSVDTIVKRFSYNSRLREFSIKYLDKGFGEIGNEELVQYIDENYMNSIQCSGLNDSQLTKRLNCYSKFKPGNYVPDILLFQNNNDSLGLNNLPYDTMVIVFWASWCSGCEKQMPKLENFLKHHPSIGALAISIDSDTSAYFGALEQYPSMIHLCSFKGWDSKAAQDYCITATPTFILVDKERRIISKYASFSSLANALKKVP